MVRCLCLMDARIFIAETRFLLAEKRSAPISGYFILSCQTYFSVYLQLLWFQSVVNSCNVNFRVNQVLDRASHCVVSSMLTIFSSMSSFSKFFSHLVSAGILAQFSCFSVLFLQKREYCLVDINADFRTPIEKINNIEFGEDFLRVI